ncbi:type II toxin-antitoxin system antitoxin SocA domain-containing protein [Rhizobium sp. OAE497]|uniref:Panacea domain-containing protein n=1 Tax=Rhizobium sp. OAE497 TaxID=2663796 RepID=UPI0018F5DD77
MAAIFDVSDYIVVKLREGGVFLNVLKLHKLMYYVQAWHLAFGRGRLFDGRFQAWVHGPVSRELYDRYRDTKSMYSTVDITDVSPLFTPTRLNDAERAHIDAVLEVYAVFTGDQLEEMTHRETPWLAARVNVPASARSETPISEETMRSFYAQRLNTGNAAAGA